MAAAGSKGHLPITSGEPAGVIINAPLVTRGWGADAETATTANPNTQMAIIQFRASVAAQCRAMHQCASERTKM